MERRSFSSNSNQSTIGNYNSDHSTAFSTSSSQQLNMLNGTHSLPSVLSSITSAVSSGGVSTPNFTYSDVNVSHRKISNAIPFTPSPDDRSNNASQIGDLYSSSTLSAMQSSTTNAASNLNQSGLNATASLANLGDYSMQMNELINDDNGDGLDMTFWENFDNFNYEADLVMNNSNSSQPYPPSTQSKSSSKRSHDSGSGSERKRKRANETKDNSNHSKSSKDVNKGTAASPLSHDIGQTLLKSNSNLSRDKKTLNLSTNTSFGTNILIGAPRPDIICIDDDEDDATNNNIGKFSTYARCEVGVRRRMYYMSFFLVYSVVVIKQVRFFKNFLFVCNKQSIHFQCELIVFYISDATVNRNSDKENGTIYPVTPTKELVNDIGTKHHVRQIYAILPLPFIQLLFLDQ